MARMAKRPLGVVRDIKKVMAFPSDILFLVSPKKEEEKKAPPRAHPLPS
jgi:hypothetical protein